MDVRGSSDAAVVPLWDSEQKLIGVITELCSQGNTQTCDTHVTEGILQMCQSKS